MELPVPIWAILLSTLSAYVVGAIWYGPKTFYPRWAKITGADDAHMKKQFGPSMVWHGISALLTSFVLAHLISFSSIATGVDGVAAGLIASAWTWLGASFTTTLSAGALDPRDKFLMLIQGGDRLVTFLLMGLILGAFLK